MRIKTKKMTNFLSKNGKMNIFCTFLATNVRLCHIITGSCKKFQKQVNSRHVILLRVIHLIFLRKFNLFKGLILFILTKFLKLFIANFQHSIVNCAMILKMRRPANVVLKAQTWFVLTDGKFFNFNSSHLA